MHATAFTAFRRTCGTVAITFGILSGSSSAVADAPTGTFSVESFQTDYFTGAATTSVPVMAPKGAAGTAPPVVLTYNSTTVDDLKKTDQGQWTGLGWTLDIGGFILRDPKNTATTSDDTFRLVFGGVAHDLVLIDSTQKIYHTKDETFWKVQYFPSSDYWILTTKDGTQHRFGFNTDSKALMLNPDLNTTIAYKYLLDQATTTSGVQIRWAYVKQTGTAPATGRSYDQAVYPDTITWAYTSGGAIGTLRKLQFVRGSRADWTDTSPTTQMSFHQTSRLDRIELYTGASLVRKYVFAYDYSIDRDPAATWGGGATGDLTLTTLTMYGADGSTAMPALSFTYTSEGRLATASNGIGGSVSFTYEHVVTTPVYRTCLAGNCTDWGTTTGTGGTLLGHILSPAALGETSPLYTQCYNPFGATSGCQDWGVQQTPGVTVLGRLIVDDGVAGTIPVYQECQRWNGASCMDLALQTTGASYRLGYIYSQPVGRYRVSVRTVSDGRGNNITTNVYYRNLALGSNGEFRGYGVARTVDALGHYTNTWFAQDDILRGRITQTESRGSDDALFTQTVNTYTSSVPYPGVTLVSQTGLDTVSCDGGQTCRHVAQTFEYDSNGNKTWTHDWSNADLTADDRHFNTVWVVDASAWIHRPSITVLYDNVWNGLRVSWLSYDGLPNGSLGGRGLLTQEERWLNGSPGTAGNPIISHAYDSYGNPTTVTDARGCATTMTYDASKTYPIAVTTCLNHTTGVHYDERFGVKTSETDANNQTTTFTYDTFGRLTQMTRPLDVSSQYGSVSHFYLDWGNPSLQRTLTYHTTQHGAANFVWNDEYFDGLGRSYSRRSQGPGTNIIYSETTVDARGLVAATSSPHFSTETPLWTQYTYDPLRRPAIMQRPDNTTVTTIYRPGVTTTTDERGNVRRVYFDPEGKPTSVDEVNGQQTSTTSYTYDAAGSLLSTTDPTSHGTTLSYDMLGRKTQVVDPNTGTWTYTYDAGGNLLSQTDAKNQSLTYTYDLFGRLLTKGYLGGGQVQWTYDDPIGGYSKARLTRVSDLAGVTNFTYDKHGRITRADRVLDGTTYSMAYAYDALDRVASETFPDTETVSYAYNEAGWVSAIPGYISSITHNARGQQTQIQYANSGVVTTRTYQPTTFRLATQSTTGPGGTLQSLTYGYDESGKVTQITDSQWTGGRTYSYDALNRLVSANGTFGPLMAGLPTPVSATFSYNAVGNLTSAGGVSYSYSDPLHPSAVTETSNGFSFTYDSNGSMLTGAGRTSTWDADNRLTAINGGSNLSFSYDFTGRRVRKTSGSDVTRYPFRGYEIDANSVITKSIFLGGQRAIEKKSTGVTLFYHNDHLGGVNVVTDATGVRVQLVEYDPWGNVSLSEGTADTTHGFNGRELDDVALGLYYYGARYYSAALARFISADSTVPYPLSTQSLDRYAYVRNNPVNAIDPSGFQDVPSIDFGDEPTDVTLPGITVYGTRIDPLELTRPDIMAGYPPAYRQSTPTQIMNLLAAVYSPTLWHHFMHHRGHHTFFVLPDNVFPAPQPTPAPTPLWTPAPLPKATTGAVPTPETFSNVAEGVQIKITVTIGPLNISYDPGTSVDFSLVLPPTLGGGVDILVDVPTNAVTQVNAGLSRHLSLGTAVVPNPDSSIGYSDKGGLIISVGLSLPSTVTTQTPLGSINMDPFAKERRPWAQSVGPSRVLGPLMK